MSNLELSLGFESVAIKQKKNILKSRLDATIRSEVARGVYLDIPLVAANMSTVVNADFCIDLNRLGALGIMHRAADDKELAREVNHISLCSEGSEWVAASIGINDKDVALSDLLVNSGANILCVDTAHGYSDFMLEFGRKIKNRHPDVKLIIGNTTNTEIMKECSDFADCVKVGIAQGFACETKNTAGCTEKQFSAVLKFKDISREYGIPIMSDGGIREASDFTKSIAAGANSVMAGKIFAECPTSAGEIVEMNGQKKKLYAGMASAYVQEKWRGGLKTGTCAEGGVRFLDMNDGLFNLLEHYSGALRSGITYGGAKDIYSLQENVEFVRFV